MKVWDVLVSVSHLDWENKRIHSWLSKWQKLLLSTSHFYFFHASLTFQELMFFFLLLFHTSNLLSGLQGVWWGQRRDTEVILLGGRVSRSPLCLYTKTPPPPHSPYPPPLVLLIHADSSYKSRPLSPPSQLRPRPLPRFSWCNVQICIKRRVLTPPPTTEQGLSSERVLASPWNLSYFFYFCQFKFLKINKNIFFL